MVYDNILQAIGNTPMIRLNHVNKPGNDQVLVKFEGLNVGGSIKTRTAWNMIRQAELAGKIGPDTVIVEPTSGNQGIGLALVGAVRGYRTIIVMPDSVSEERRKLVRHYGAEVLLVHDDGDIGKCIEECLETALRMQEEDPNVFVPQQFSNPDNNMAQRRYTAHEILAQVDGPIHGFCSGIGTGGTITGIGEILREILIQSPLQIVDGISVDFDIIGSLIIQHFEHDIAVEIAYYKPLTAFKTRLFILRYLISEIIQQIFRIVVHILISLPLHRFSR